MNKQHNIQLNPYSIYTKIKFWWKYRFKKKSYYLRYPGNILYKLSYFTTICYCAWNISCFPGTRFRTNDQKWISLLFWYGKIKTPYFNNTKYPRIATWKKYNFNKTYNILYNQSHQPWWSWNSTTNNSKWQTNRNKISRQNINCLYTKWLSHSKRAIITYNRIMF